MRFKAMVGYLACALVVALALGATTAHAFREFLVPEKVVKEENGWLKTSEARKEPPPEGQIEDACGLAVQFGKLFVSDYHHKVVDIFSAAEGAYEGQIPVPVSNPPEGPCGLALDSTANLYVNLWHESVLRLTSPILTFDIGVGANKPTGVAVDGAVEGAGDVYVDDRRYIAVYEPSGAPLLDEGQPLRIGLGSLGDAFGLAVFAGRIYVPDAEDDTVKVYEPSVDRFDPVATIDGPGEGEKFTSLHDAAVAVDPTNEHLLVVDNLQPGFEHPKAAVYEFDASGAFLDRLSHAPVDGEPSGVAVDPITGDLFITTGNGEKSNVYAYGPYMVSSPTEAQASPPGEGPVSPAGATSAALGPLTGAHAARKRSASASVVVQRRGVRVSFDGKLTPHVLPRHGAAPVGIAVDAKIASTGDFAPPQLRKIAIAINRNGHFTSQGLPLCSLREIQPSTTAGARAACGGSLVGEGHFSADVKLPEQSPFPSEGKVLAFNGRVHGRPAILAHIYGAQPAPTSAVLPFQIRGSHGTYGTILEASLPRATGNWGFVTGLRMSLRRHFTYRGKSRSFLSAGCPAPPGFPSAAFPLARTDFAFAGGLTLVSVLSRTCRARG